MKACFDTSVLVPALLRQHPQHAVCFSRFSAVCRGKVEGYLTTHAIAELFATLTALPLKPRLQPADAEKILRDSVIAHFTVVPLMTKHYTEALALAALRNVSSGAVYDALHLVGARSAGCKVLYTLNLRHFRALAPDDPLIAAP